MWLDFVNAGTVLIYLAAACGGPTHDAALAAIDAALGFDWTRWYNFLAPYRDLRFVLWLGYLSLFPQILVSIFWFSCHDLDYFNYELAAQQYRRVADHDGDFPVVPGIRSSGAGPRTSKSRFCSHCAAAGRCRSTCRNCKG